VHEHADHGEGVNELFGLRPQLACFSCRQVRSERVACQLLGAVGFTGTFSFQVFVNDMAFVTARFLAFD